MMFTFPFLPVDLQHPVAISGCWCVYFGIQNHFRVGAFGSMLYPAHFQCWCWYLYFVGTQYQAGGCWSVYFVCSTIYGWMPVYSFCFEHHFRVGADVSILFPAQFQGRCWCIYFISSTIYGGRIAVAAV